MKFEAVNTTGMTVGEKIKALRKMSKVEVPMSRAWLARAIGVAPSTITNLEEGKFQPSDQSREQIAKALGVELSLLED